MQTIIGTLEVTKSGKGFLLQGERGDPNKVKDVPIAREDLGGALQGDTVEVATKSDKWGLVGRVVKVIERKNSSFVGEVIKTPVGLRLRTDDTRVYFDFAFADESGVDVGTKVMADVVDWAATPPAVTVRQVFGKAGENETEMRAIAASRGFDTVYPAAVVKEAEALYQKEGALLRQGYAGEHREDFRTTTTMTIDPPDAKDFDDAISLKTLPDGTREVGIHIADVSHFVTPGTLLDHEAVRRATSVYLVDRTIPMLPPELSNDLCSLMPNVDRLVFSAVFTVTPDNQVVDRRFTKGIIKSAKRFTYDEADASLKTVGLPYHDELASLWSLSSSLRVKRIADGAIMFDNDELKPVLDDNKDVIAFKRIPHTESHQLIEELMLLANREVATYVAGKLGKKSRLFPYRVHDLPKAERIQELSVFLNALGFRFKSGNQRPTAKDLNTLFDEIKGKPEEALIKTAAVRSMSKAIYDTKNIGHFGLSFEFYAHFTSPIRRYPDLMVHRTLASLIAGKHIDDTPEEIGELAQHCSEREAAAAEAERASVKLKQVEYFAKLIGTKREGVVSGITEWGLYIQDKDTGAEGMVRLMSLTDDTYEYDQKKYAVIGKTTKKKNALGDPATFIVDRVDLETRTIDLKLAP